MASVLPLSLRGPPTSGKLTCLVCFGMETGVKWQDFFVRTDNGHSFHYCCVKYMVENGTSICPACDEDLRFQKLVRIPMTPSVATYYSQPTFEQQLTPEQHLEDFLGHSGRSGSEQSPVVPSTSASAELVQDAGSALSASFDPQSEESVVKGKSKKWKGVKGQLKKKVNHLVDELMNGPIIPSNKDKTLPLPKTGSNCNQISNSRTLPVAISGPAASFGGLGQSTAKNIMPPDFTFKVAILGDYSVGKSSLLHRFADESFNHQIAPTVGCDLRIKTIEVANKLIRLSLWDTAGQERFREALIGSYLRKTDGIIFCFDVTNLESLASLHEWYEFAQIHAPEHAMKIMVGNKLDMWDSERRAVEPSYIANVANLLNMAVIYCSAKDAVNVHSVFRTLVSQILEYRVDIMEGENVIHDADKIFQLGNNGPAQKKKEKCC